MSALPASWATAELGELLPISYGKALAATLRQDQGEYRVFGSNGVVGNHDAALTTGPTIIVGRKGAAGAVHYSAGPCWVIDTAYFAERSEALDLKFASHLLSAIGLAKLDRSTAIPSLSRDDYSAVRVPVPPKPEQRRIVEKLEELISDIDAGSAALERGRANLKRYRAAVLKAAVEGRLTEKWRTANPCGEPAEKLLKRILIERKKRWEEAQLAKYPEKAQIRQKGWRESYAEPARPDTSSLPRLPESWAWVRAEQICEFITKGTTPSASLLSSGNGEVPFLKVYNLTSRGVLDFSIDPTFVSTRTHRGFLARSRVFPGDVLMNIVGPPLGKVSIVPDQFREWNINQAIAIFRPVAGVDRRYLAACLLTDSILDWAVARGKATAGQTNLTLEICRDLPLPLPPYEEQLAIAEEVSRHVSIVEVQEQMVRASELRASRLRQSILRRAFDGKLVAQDPADEPASELLARIRKERKTVAAAIKNGRAKRAA